MSALKSKSLSSEELPFRFSLHLRHPSIDPEEVSRELKLPALESFKAGAPRTSRSGIAAAAVHGETCWAAIIDPLTWSPPTPSPEGSFTLGWALGFICACLHKRHKEFLHRLSAQGGSATLLVAYSTAALNGLRLQPDMARQISDLGLTIKFELTDIGDLL